MMHMRKFPLLNHIGTPRKPLTLPCKNALRLIARIFCLLLLAGGCLMILKSAQLSLWQNLHMPLRGPFIRPTAFQKIFKDFQAFDTWFRTLGKRIVFVETSKGGKCFTYRQSCAVESTAHRNPDVNIVVFLRTKSIPDNCPTLEQFTNVTTDDLGNVNFVLYDLEDVFQDTPLVEWGQAVESGNITSPYMYSHLSDALRFTLVHKYNTIYMDLDMITLRSLDKIFEMGNFLIKESTTHLSSAMFGFQTPHPFTLEALREFADHYNASSWAANGPRLLDRVLNHRGCYINQSVCDNITLVDPGHMYPVPWNGWQLLFNVSTLINGPRLLHDQEVYAIHLWNNMSRNRTTNPTSDRNTVNVCAENSCPRTFTLAKNSRMGLF